MDWFSLTCSYFTIQKPELFEARMSLNLSLTLTWFSFSKGLIFFDQLSFAACSKCQAPELIDDPFSWDDKACRELWQSDMIAIGDRHNIQVRDIA